MDQRGPPGYRQQIERYQEENRVENLSANIARLWHTFCALQDGSEKLQFDELSKQLRIADFEGTNVSCIESKEWDGRKYYSFLDKNRYFSIVGEQIQERDARGHVVADYFRNPKLSGEAKREAEWRIYQDHLGRNEGTAAKKYLLKIVKSALSLDETSRKKAFKFFDLADWQTQSTGLPIGQYYRAGGDPETYFRIDTLKLDNSDYVPLFTPDLEQEKKIQELTLANILWQLFSQRVKNANGAMNTAERLLKFAVAHELYYLFHNDHQRKKSFTFGNFRFDAYEIRARSEIFFARRNESDGRAGLYVCHATRATSWVEHWLVPKVDSETRAAASNLLKELINRATYLHSNGRTNEEKRYLYALKSVGDFLRRFKFVELKQHLENGQLFVEYLSGSGNYLAVDESGTIKVKRIGSSAHSLGYRYAAIYRLDDYQRTSRAL